MSRKLLVAICTTLAALLWTAEAQAGPKVGLVYASSTPAVQSDIKGKLEALAVFEAVELVDATGAAPTLMKLKEYAAVLVYSDATSFGDRAGTGNVLTQYIEGGGGVVVLDMFSLYNSGGLAGDFMTKYNLTDIGTYRLMTAGSNDLGMFDMAHPLFAGVTALKPAGSRCYIYDKLTVLKNGATVIGQWKDGNALALVGTPNGKTRVDLNISITSTAAGSFGCYDPTGDAWKLMANALQYVANPLRATPSVADFGDVGVMTLSPPKTIEIKNGGSAPVTINSGTLNPNTEFTVTLPMGVSYPITLNPGDTFSFDARLRPAMKGARQAAYTLTPASGPALSVQLRGNGIGPRFSASPTTIDFGGAKFTMPGMSTLPPKTVRLQNGGGGQLKLKTIAVSDAMNFSVDTMGLALPNVLVGGAFAEVLVKFTPRDRGKYTATLDITYDLVGEATDLKGTIPLSATAGDPFIQLPGANITLQSVRVGLTGPMEFVTITNTGLAPLSITGLMLSGAHAGDFVVRSTASMGSPIVVPPNGGQTDIEVQFVPKVQGLRTAKLTIANDDPDAGRAMASLNLNARGTTATFAMSPMAIDFSKDGMMSGIKQQTGTCSSAKTVEISNSGDDSLNITSISFDGAGAGSYRHTYAGPKLVPAGGKLILPVQFCPVKIGAQVADLVIQTDLMAGHTAKLGLNGIGTGPRLTASVANIDFGSVYINTVSQAVDLVLKNEGDADLRFIKSTLPVKPFTVTALPPDNSTLAPGMSVTVKVTAAPTMSIQSTGSLEIQVNDQVLMGVLRVPLTVTGQQASITVMPKTLMFPSTIIGVKSAEQTVTVVNTGLAPLSNLRAALSDRDANDYGLSGELPMTLEPSGKANLKVYMRPVGVGMRQARLVIKAAGLAVDEQVQLQGTGKSIDISCNTDKLDFGVRAVGDPLSKVIFCKNSDADPVDIDLAFIDNLSEWSAEAEQLTIPGGGDLQIKISFNPMSSGPRDTRMEVRLKDSGTAVFEVSVEGTGAPAKDTDMKMSGGCSTGGAPGGPAALASLLLCGLLLRRRKGAKRA